MFEAVEVGSRLSKAELQAVLPDLRVDLVNAQFDLRAAPFPVVVLLAGDDRVGIDAVLDRLHEWMDARYLSTHVFRGPTAEEAERPRFWRYWRALPPHGRIGLFVGAWALNAIADRLGGRCDEEELLRRAAHAAAFERALVDDGALVLKYFLHVPKKVHKERRKLAREGAPGARRFDDPDWEVVVEDYRRTMRCAERYVRATDEAWAPWTLVEGTDAQHRDLTVASHLRDALQAHLARELPPGPSAARSPAAAPAEADARARTVLDTVDLTARLEDDDYDRRLPEQQERLRLAAADAWEAGLSTVLAFEGWDAAGKGGAIRRITNALPAFFYDVLPVAAPTEEERAHHFLWRFWRRLPRAGRLAIFDRSWYGRVLVERVEGLASEAEWRRAYAEIRDFEEQLVEHGCVLLKFWLHVDADEQLRRFQARERTPYKKYKITAEDYRNRRRRDEYARAVDELVARTSTARAPWHLVAANDKRWARVEVLRTVCDALERALGER